MYRGDLPSVVCYLHASAPAPQSCAICSRPICDLCVAYMQTRPHCPECAGRFRKAAVRRRSLVTLVAALVCFVAGGIAFRALLKPQRRDHGPFEARIHTLELDLASDRCNEEKQLELINLLGKARDPNGMTHRWAIFVKSCPHLANKYGFEKM